MKYFIFVLAFVALISCKKENQNPVMDFIDSSSFQGDDKSIFVNTFIVGTSEQNGSIVAAYWNNNKEYLLSDQISIGYGIFLDGSDVYVAGCENNLPVYLKNGIKVPLHGEVYSFAKDILVSGSDVWVAGNLSENGGYQPVFWKNGIVQKLPVSGGSSCSAIGMLAGEVYFAGTDGTRACYWNSGKIFYLSDTSGSSSVFSMSPNSKEMIFGGGFDDPTHLLEPVYWNNGMVNVISRSQGYVTAIYATDSVVVSTGEGPSLYWWNNHPLLNKIPGEQTTGISFKNLKVIVSGNVIEGNKYYMVLHINGILHVVMDQNINKTSYDLFVHL